MSRRAFLTRSAAALGVVAVGGLAGCSASNDDAKELGSTTTTTAGSAATTAAVGSTTTTPTTVGASSAGAIPAGAELAVKFTYAPDDFGGRVENPYVAVWIEDSKEALVAALGVWYQSGPKERYLSELVRWSGTAGAATALSAVSSATRAPGEYSVVWDGADLDGARAAGGAYFVCIEAAREHGPYSLIRQSVAIAAEASKVDLASNGELSGATADYHLA